MTSCDSVYGRLLCAPFVRLRSEERAFCVRANAPNGPLLRISVYTRYPILRGWGDVLFFCQMQRRKAAGLRATCATHTLSDWCLVVLFVSVRTLVGKSEALLIHSHSHRERDAVHVFFHAVVDSLCCRDCPLLWSPNCSGSHTFYSNFRNPLSSHVVVWCLLLFLKLGFDFTVLAPRQLLSSPTVG